MKNLYIIFSSQEYKEANHQNLWKSIANIDNNTVLIINIPADYVVSPIRGQFKRIIEAKKGLQQLDTNLFLIRPQLYIRPEILPSYFYPVIAKIFWKQIEICFPKIKNYNIKLLIYNPHWVEILHKTQKGIKIGYYLFDEIRKEASTDKKNMKRLRQDLYACKNSDVIFTMTSILATSRESENSKIYTLGNGACYVKETEKISRRLQHSVALIGNFRNWIDQNLLKDLVLLRPDVDFYFIGPIEKDMSFYFNDLLNSTPNTFYGGIIAKEKINTIYEHFSVVIVPYKQNSFMHATRPIKIVEAIMAGTPVVTIPIDGYQESQFIRYARTKQEFSTELDYCFTHPIDKKSLAYKNFVQENSWKAKAKSITSLL